MILAIFLYLLHCLAVFFIVSERVSSVTRFHTRFPFTSFVRLYCYLAGKI